MKKFRVLLRVLAVCAVLGTALVAQAAPIVAAPTPVTQPDGTELLLYSSGDEYFNYLHDQAGRIVMRREDGWYVYAENADGAPVPTGGVVTQADLEDSDPGAGMTADQVDLEAHPELRIDREMPEGAEGTDVFLGGARSGGSGGEETAEVPSDGFDAPAALQSVQTQQKMANLVIFIRFSDEEEFITGTRAEPLAPIPASAQTSASGAYVNFGESYRQVSQYMQKVSNGKFDVESTVLTASADGTVLASYQDVYPRSYFQAYDAATNPGGVDGNSDERAYREMYLLERALIGVADSLPGDIELDYNGDGCVDNITFIVSGSTEGWNDLLWPHSWALQLDRLYLRNRDGAGKLCYQFNFNFANPRYAGVGVLSHELLHAVGFPDLYRYDYSGDPVGRWDAMASTDYADPQFLGAYLKDAYTSWGNLGSISRSGTYALWPIGTTHEDAGVGAEDPLYEGFAIRTGVLGESIIVEARENGAAGDVTEDNVPQSGLLVYRANKKTVDGNRNGTATYGNDEVYVFRPNDASVNAGTGAYLDLAALGAEGGIRAAVGAAKEDESVAAEDTLYLNDGSNSGIVVDQVQRLEDGRWSFQVTLPSSPEPVAPGRYDVDAGDYYLEEPGEYIFYGATSAHHITVAPDAVGVRIVLEGGVTIDLSGLSESAAPIAVGRGAQASVSLPEGTRSVLMASAYMAGITVEEDAELELIGPGSLRAAGGTGAAGVGGDAYSAGGSLTLRDLTATLSGGEEYKVKLNGSADAVTFSYGSAALGAGHYQVCGDILIDGCRLEVEGYHAVESIATSYYNTSSGEYLAGGEVTIQDSVVSAQGAVTTRRLTAQNSDLSVSLGAQGYYYSALSALEGLELTDCQTSLRVEGSYHYAINGLTMDICPVTVRGGSLTVYSRGAGAAGAPIAIDGRTEVVLAASQYPVLWAGRDDASADQVDVTSPTYDDADRAVILAATLPEALEREQTFTLLAADGTRSRFTLPAGTLRFAVSVPGVGTYSIENEARLLAAGLAVDRAGVNHVGVLQFSTYATPAIELDLSAGDGTIREGGLYQVSGAGQGTLTVEPGVVGVTIYLNGVDLAGRDGPALRVGENAQVQVVACPQSDNTLRGAAGYPALSGGAGSRIALTGPGSLLALGGAGASALTGDGLWTDRTIRLTALSDQASVCQRSDGGWTTDQGTPPVVLRLTLAEPLAEDAALYFTGGHASRAVPAPAGTRSALYVMERFDDLTLATDALKSPLLSCRQEENVYEGVVLSPRTPVTATLDLSERSYILYEDGDYTVVGTTALHTIRVTSGVAATLRLQNVSVELDSKTSTAEGILDLSAGARVVLDLPEGTDNTLTTEVSQGSAVHVPQGARLTITGAGVLRAKGGGYAAAIGASAYGQGGTVVVQGGNIIFTGNNGGSGLHLGGSGARVEIEGGSITETASENNGTVGGQGAVVILRGGRVDLTPYYRPALGGASSRVSILGGELRISGGGQGYGVGGQNARIDIQGGQILVQEAQRDASSPGMAFAVGGESSTLSMTGGSLRVILLSTSYPASGALGGGGAVCSFGRQADVLVRFPKNATPALASGAEVAAGRLLEIRFQQALTADETLTLASEDDPDQTVSVPLQAGDAGFLVGLDAGLWSLSNAAGGLGGTYDLTQTRYLREENVTFNHLAGVYFPSETRRYTGEAQSLEVVGLPQEGVSVTYEGNGQREPGVWPVTATITHAGGSYTLAATLTIEPAPLAVLGITAQDKVYDGGRAAVGQVLLDGAVGSDQPQAAAQFLFDTPDAGADKTVTATVTGLEGVWAQRYTLDLSGGNTFTATAAITKAAAGISIPSGDLLQMPGDKVRVPEVATSPSGLAYTVTYTPAGGEAQVELPTEAGEYAVTVTIVDDNYEGVWTGVLTLQNGIDLRELSGDYLIEAPGDYFFTSGGEETGNRIVVAEVTQSTFDTSQVHIYLSDAWIHAADQPALDVRQYEPLGTHNWSTVIHAVDGTHNVLWSDAAAPFVYADVAGTSSGSGSLALLRGDGGAPAGIGAIRFDPGEIAPFLTVTGTDYTSGDLFASVGGKRWATYVFRTAAEGTERVNLSIDGGKPLAVTVPQGCRYLKVLGGLGEVLELTDVNGERLSRRTLSDDLTIPDVPFLAEPKSGTRVSVDLSAADTAYPIHITQNGIYTLSGAIDNPALPGGAGGLVEVDGDLDVELVLDNVDICKQTKGPIIQVGGDTQMTLTAVGQSVLVNTFDSVYHESGTGSSLTLRGEGAVEAQSSWFPGLYEGESTAGRNCAVYTGALDIQGGDWTISQRPDRRDGDVWCVYVEENAALAPNSLVLDARKGDGTAVNSSGDKSNGHAGGIWVGRDLTLSGGGSVNVEASGYGMVTPMLRAVFCGGDLTVDGPAVTLNAVNSGGSWAVGAASLRGLSGSADLLTSGATGSVGGGFQVSDIQAAAGFRLTGVDQTPVSEGTGDPANALVKSDAVLTGVGEDAPVLYLGQFDSPGVVVDSAGGMDLTFTDGNDLSVTVHVPAWNAGNPYLNFAVLLPHQGAWYASYSTDGQEWVAQVNAVSATGVVTGKLGARRAQPLSLTLRDQSFVWDGTTKALAVEGILPEGAAVTYEGNGQIEPGTYLVRATVTAPGYAAWTGAASLTIQKRPLSVAGAAAEDKPVYDGTTATTGTVTLSPGVGSERPTATAASYQFEDANVGAGKRVLVSGIALDEAWTGHYALDATTAETTAAILEKRVVEVTWNEPTLTQVYGAVTAPVAVAADPCAPDPDPNAPGDAKRRLEVRLIWPEGEDLLTLPGTRTIAAQVEDANCQGGAVGTFRVQPRPLTVTALQIPSIREGDDLRVLVTDSAAFTLDDPGVVEGDEVRISYLAVYPDDIPGEKEAAIQDLVLTGAQADRYRLEGAPAAASGTVLEAPTPVLVSLSVTPPEKTAYQTGEDLDLTGLTVTAEYSDGAAKDVTEEAVCAPTALTQAGTVTITVTYQDRTAEFTVTVTDPAGEDPGEDPGQDPGQDPGEGPGEDPSGGSGSSGGGSSGGGSGSSSGGSSGVVVVTAKSTKSEPDAAQPEPEPALPLVQTGAMPFADLDGHWAREQAEWVWRRGLVKGTSQTRFSPELPMTRAMFVTILGRLEGIDASGFAAAATPFADVATGSWYAPYVAWAYGEGLARGRAEDCFAPEAPMTREEIALLLQRYVQWTEMEQPRGETLLFTDETSISPWAVGAVREAQTSGLLQGYPDGSFAPRRDLSRAEAAALLYRLAQRRFSL